MSLPHFAGTTESDLTSATADTTGTVMQPWHPKLTVSRMFVISSTLGLGLAKAVASYQGQSIAAVTLEWVTGVILFLVCMYLSWVEEDDDPQPAWLFKADLVGIIWKSLRDRGIWAPSYQTNERSMDLLVKPKHPPLTLYRLVVTTCVLVSGLLKATLSYMGEDTSPTTVEWVFGAIIIVALYYIGLYESSAQHIFPAVFETNYSAAVIFSIAMFTQIGGIALGSVWALLGAKLISLMLTPSWLEQPSGHPSTRIEEMLIPIMNIGNLAAAMVFGVIVGVWITLHFSGTFLTAAFPLAVAGLHWGCKKASTLLGRYDNNSFQEGGISRSCLNAIPCFVDDPPPFMRRFGRLVAWIAIVFGYIMSYALALILVQTVAIMFGYALYLIWLHPEASARVPRDVCFWLFMPLISVWMALSLVSGICIWFFLFYLFFRMSLFDEIRYLVMEKLPFPMKHKDL